MILTRKTIAKVKCPETLDNTPPVSEQISDQIVYGNREKKENRKEQY